MDVFYKGEDISFTMGIFEDEMMECPVDISHAVIDVVFYTSGDEEFIHASTNLASDCVAIGVVNDHTMQLVLPKVEVEKLTCGQVNMEIRVKVEADTQSRIIKTYIFSLQDTIIKDL